MDISREESPKKDVVLSVEPLCAWCLSEEGLPAGEGSHGICGKHAAAFLLQWKALRGGDHAARLH
jgi:hypothetical protein